MHSAGADHRFGATGDVALFEIEDPYAVAVLAVRHPREDDYSIR
ncbi:hypothetical protein [Luteimonas suaedae]